VLVGLGLAARRLYARLKVRLRAWRGWDPCYPIEEIVERALLGREALYPHGYGSRVYGARTHKGCGCPRIPLVEDLLVLAPPAFTPGRLEVMAELFREPVYTDVKLEARIGGFKARMPVATASMGSTSVASRHSLAIARGAAAAGIPYAIGENVATVRGYDRRLTGGHPSFIERALAYLEGVREGYGGLVIQQSVEDAYDELWNRVYSDPRLDPYIDEGLLAFEIKIGQGAKPGLGGVIKIPREQAERLKAKYHIDLEPGASYATRYSVPATFTEEILRGMIRNIKTAYPRVRVWVKVGGMRDALEVVRVADEEGVDAVVLDGMEGGTGMAPKSALDHLGLPTISMLSIVREARRRGYKVDILLAGRLYTGFHLTVALALGASGVYIGRPLVIAAAASPQGVERYLESLAVEAQMLISALGKYSVDKLGPEDVASLDPHVAGALGVAYALRPWEPLEAEGRPPGGRILATT
jgi:hypothetical protein